MTDDASSGEVILFPRARDDAPEITPPVERKDREPATCRHRRRTVMDKEAHQMTCADCGQVLDCFDWLYAYIGRWDSENTHYRLARQQRRQEEERLAELRRLERNTKSRIRKGGLVISPAAARAAYEQLDALSYVYADRLREGADRADLERLLGRFGYKPDAVRLAMRELRRLLALEPVEEEEDEGAADGAPAA